MNCLKKRPAKSAFSSADFSCSVESSVPGSGMARCLGRQRSGKCCVRLNWNSALTRVHFGRKAKSSCRSG